jgi:hypothetical protein
MDIINNFGNLYSADVAASKKWQELEETNPSIAFLRSLIQSSLSQHNYRSAVFFADKLLTLSGGISS